MRSREQLHITNLLRLLEHQKPLFLDRNLGNRKLASLLAAAGIPHRCHSAFFPPDAPDDQWIPECARNDWIIVTGDKRIETDPINRQAVINSRARMFLLDEGGSRAIGWAAALIVSRTRIYEIVREYDGPFFATITRETSRLVSPVRTVQVG